MDAGLLRQYFMTGDRVEILSSRGTVYARGVVIRADNVGPLSQFVTVAYDKCPIRPDCQHCTSEHGCLSGIHAYAFCRKETSER